MISHFYKIFIYIFPLQYCLAYDFTLPSWTEGLFQPKSSHPNLRYYEKLHSSQFSHHIVKRGLKESNHRFNKIKEVSFSALGRDFRLILNPRKGLLDPYFKAYVVDENGKEKLITVDHEYFYEGRVFGENSSDVSAHMEDGVMTATIHIPEDTYHVEGGVDYRNSSYWEEREREKKLVKKGS